MHSLWVIGQSALSPGAVGGCDAPGAPGAPSDLGDTCISKKTTFKDTEAARSPLITEDQAWKHLQVGSVPPRYAGMGLNFRGNLTRKK